MRDPQTQTSGARRARSSAQPAPDDRDEFRSDASVVPCDLARLNVPAWMIEQAEQAGCTVDGIPRRRFVLARDSASWRHALRQLSARQPWTLPTRRRVRGFAMPHTTPPSDSRDAARAEVRAAVRSLRASAPTSPAALHRFRRDAPARGVIRTLPVQSRYRYRYTCPRCRCHVPSHAAPPAAAGTRSVYCAWCGHTYNTTHGSTRRDVQVAATPCSPSSGERQPSPALQEP